MPLTPGGPRVPGGPPVPGGPAVPEIQITKMFVSIFPASF